MSRERYRARGRSIEVECYAEVDIDDFATKVLTDELKRRGVPLPASELEEIVRAYEALRVGRSDDAQLILERFLRPKWKTIEACEKQMGMLHA